MKVGVVLSGSMPDAGGGYTFQADIFDGLGELATSSKHEFVVFHYTDNIELYKKNPKFEKFVFVSYRPIQRNRLLDLPSRLKNYLKRVVVAMLSPIYSSPLLIAQEPRSHLEITMLNHGVDMAWFVSGGWWGAIDIPYIATVWDLMHMSDPWFPELSAKGEWKKREAALSVFLKRATAIITGTQVGKKEIERFYNVPPEHIHLMPHPTPRFALHAPDTGRSVLPRYGISGKYLLYPAQFWPHKNHVGLLHVLKSLERMGAEDYSLVFVGSDQGNLSFVKQRVAELALKDKVFFLGFIPLEDLIAFYRNAFALAYVSFCGPENLPPLEAFALGCPVLASDIPGAREQLGASASLIDPTKPEEVAKTILALEGDEGWREELIRQGFQRASSWTSTEYVRAVFSILDGFAPIRACWPGNQ